MKTRAHRYGQVMVIGQLTATLHGKTVRFEVNADVPVVLGRSSDCAVRLTDPKVSRQHCQIVVANGRLRVVDLGSSQGLVHRGERCAECEIELGDGFHVGQTFVRFESVQEDRAVATAAPGDAAASTEAGGADVGATEPEVGKAMAGYQLEDVLGRSDRCTVYRARPRDGFGSLALKVLRLSPQADRATRERAAFEVDVRTAAAIVDPRLLRVLGFGRAEPWCFAALEMVPGKSLAAMLAGGQRLPASRLLPLLRDLLGALDVLHEQGLVHGGVHPGNVFVLDDGSGRLADARAHARLRAGEAPTFAAPEVLAGGPAGSRADLYALGCVAYAALTGAPPFVGTADEVRAAQGAQKPGPLSARDASIPAALDRLVRERLLAIAPTDRPQSAADALVELEDVEDGVGNGSARVTAPAASAASARRDAIEQVGEGRRRQAGRATVVAATLSAQAVVFAIHLVAAAALLVLAKAIWGFDLYALFGVAGPGGKG
ncbi:MAG: FHA domain-containing protein [Planctomycetes bacterium]|nr:FHA domain-containing protein [Planctomycetota bacterium]